MPRKSLVFVPQQTLNGLFNDSGYYDMVCAGQIHTEVKKSYCTDTPPSNAEYCTQSQIITYKDHAGNFLAEVHQYQRKDGTLAASGLPEPKKLLYDNQIFVAK